MTFTLTIKLDNEAFSGDKRGLAIASILRREASYLADAGGQVDGMDVIIFDVNGNGVGSATIA